MSDDQLFSITYQYDDAFFNVNATQDTHTLLQTDPTAFKNYIKNQSDDFPDSIIENATPADIPIEPFKWEKKTTLLLITAHKERKADFRNPKIKKKILWTGIKEIFNKHGYFVTEEELDRKWRNLKKTYTTTRDNKRSTGRGRIVWEFFEEFEQIYIDDCTINLPQTISAFPSQFEVPTQSPTTALPGPSQIYSPSQFYTTAPTNNLPGPSQIYTVPQKHLTIATTPSMPPTPNSQPRRTKNLYHLRKRLADIEDKRVDELRLLRLAIEKSNEIQQERNKIFNLLLQQNLKH